MKVILSQEELQAGIFRLAEDIRRAAGGRPLTIVGVMTGSVVMLADLIRLLEMPLRVGVVQASSYRNRTTPGELKINVDLMPDITDRDVILVDDIFDTGHTLTRVMELMRDLKPSSLRSAVLLRKAGRKVVLEPDFIAFEIPDEFVVGYGLDYQDAFRNLPYLAALEPTDLSQSGEHQEPDEPKSDPS